MSGTVALVTGGNRGIGLEVVKTLAQYPNRKVLLGCRDIGHGKKTAAGLTGDVEVVELDLSSEDSIRSAISTIQNDFGHVDVLVNNAGVLKEGSVIDTTLEGVEESFQVHVLGPVQLIRAFLPKMIENGFGRIVNVTSGWGSFHEGLTGPFAYSTSKAALNAVTLTASQKLPANVKINSACPGWVRTRMGGMMASRSVGQGAETIVWLAGLPADGPSGGFFRDKSRIEW